MTEPRQPYIDALGDNLAVQGFVRDRRGRYLSVTDGFLDGTGLSPADLLGRTDAATPWAAAAEFIRDDDQRLLASGGLGRTQISMVPPERDNWVLSVADKWVSGDTIRGAVYDITNCVAPLEWLSRLDFERERIAWADGVTLRRRDATLLHYYLRGRTAEETAAALSLSKSGVEKALERIRKKCRAAFGCRCRGSELAAALYDDGGLGVFLVWNPDYFNTTPVYRVLS